jgi:hypothetical protein
MDHTYGLMRNTTLSQMKSGAPAPTWKFLPFSRKYIDHISEVADEPAFIDPENKKKDMWKATLNGRGSFFVCECEYARIYYVSEQSMDEAVKEVPLNLWGRIFQAFTKGNQFWQVVIFAANRPRVFPEKGQLIGPVHINGGAAKSCMPDSILIIRKEEATRVLVHELLHAACTDDLSKPVDDIEGWTEAWAEWFLCALVAKNRYDFDHLWKKQVAWALAQADKCYKRGHIKSIEDYGARYIVRRINVWKRLGMIPIGLPRAPVVDSLRFTITDFEEAETK